MLKYLTVLFLIACGSVSQILSSANAEFSNNDFDSIAYYSLNEHVKNVTLNPYIELDAFIEDARSSARLLSPDVLNEVLLLKNGMVDGDYVWLKGLPQDLNLAKTPGLDLPLVKDTYVSEYCLSLFATILGEPFNYIQEENGNIFRNIRPTRRNEKEQTSDGSKVDLELHTEIAFHPFKPDYLMLYCLRGDRNKEAFTLVSSLSKVLEQLDAKSTQILRDKQFLTGIDVSFGNPDKTKYWGESIPVLYGPEDRLMITYDLDLMVGLTEEARNALEVLKKAILKVQEKVCLQPGDLLIFNNRRVIHGRTAFKAYYDGYDRWLQRVYVSTDKEFAENILINGRIICTEF